MRLVTISISTADIDNGQVWQDKSRWDSCPMSLASARVMPDFTMVGKTTIQCGVFGIPLPEEAIAWLEHADRHFQGLETRRPEPITFNVIHPL
jgi:hypothetical protein